MRAVALAAFALAGTLAGAGSAGAQGVGAGTAAAQEARAAPPDVRSADAAIVVDARNGEVMFAKRPRERHAIASTTKLMTALLALERASPSDVYAAPSYNALPVESKIDLATGERMAVRDLLEALLLESANDAAVSLAEGVSGSRDAFVTEMNARAGELGLDDTSYANPIGLDDPLNYSTAADLAALTVRLLRKPRFARIVDMPVAELETGARPRVIDNRNRLIAEHPWVSGVKTGHTAERRLRAGRLGHRQGWSDGGQRRTRRAERGRTRRGHAGAAALGPRPLPPRKGARPAPGTGERVDRVPRR